MASVSAFQQLLTLFLSLSTLRTFDCRPYHPQVFASELQPRMPPKGPFLSATAAAGGADVSIPNYFDGAYNGISLPFNAVVSLKNSAEEHVCGGSLISPQVVLTAAHCFDRALIGNTPVAVDIGRVKRVSKQKFDFETRLITQVLLHQNYSRQNHFEFDAALLFLDSPASVTSFHVDLATNSSCFESSQGCDLKVLGWGKLDYNQGLADHLQIAAPPTLTRDQCQEHRPAQKITDNMLCAGNLLEGGVSSCSGDSGGPAFILQDGAYKQVGIISWSNGCGDVYTPEVFASVPSLLDWIALNRHPQLVQ